MNHITMQKGHIELGDPRYKKCEEEDERFQISNCWSLVLFPRGIIESINFCNMILN
jgi:hypothetical protein